jgi:hypothetical protein
MGKIDDMRKMREKQFEEAQRAAANAPKNGVAKNGVVHAPKPVAATDAELDKEIPEFEDRSKPVQRGKKIADEPSTPKVADGEKARCSDCGKMKPVQNGVMAMHQKGMGKMCAGSRKPPSP